MDIESAVNQLATQEVQATLGQLVYSQAIATARVQALTERVNQLSAENDHLRQLDAKGGAEDPEGPDFN